METRISYRISNLLYRKEIFYFEHKKIESVSNDIVSLLKNTTLTHYEAEAALDCAKVILSEQTI